MGMPAPSALVADLAPRLATAFTSLQHRIAEAVTNFYDEGAALALCGLKFKVRAAPCAFGCMHAWLTW